MKTCPVPLLLGAGQPVGMVQGEESRIVEAVVSCNKDGPNTRVLPASTQKVWVSLELQGTRAGTTLTCIFIAEKTQLTPANYEIDQVTLKVGGLINRVQCSLSHPNKDWPAGTYRVEVYLDNPAKAALTLPFSIAPDLE